MDASDQILAGGCFGIDDGEGAETGVIARAGGEAGEVVAFEVLRRVGAFGVVAAMLRLVAATTFAAEQDEGAAGYGFEVVGFGRRGGDSRRQAGAAVDAGDETQLVAPVAVEVFAIVVVAEPSVVDCGQTAMCTVVDGCVRRGERGIDHRDGDREQPVDHGAEPGGPRAHGGEYLFRAYPRQHVVRADVRQSLHEGEVASDVVGIYTIKEGG